MGRGDGDDGTRDSTYSLETGDDKTWQRPFSFIRRGSSRHKKKYQTNNQQGMELLGILESSSRRPSAISLRSPNRNGDHLKPNGGFGIHRRTRSRSRSPSPRSPSPRPRHDIGFSDAVSDVVDLVKTYEHKQPDRKHHDLRAPRAKIRGDEYIVHPHDSPTRRSPDPWPNKSAWQPTGRWSPEYHSSCLERRSRSPSPKATPTRPRISVASPASAHSLPPPRRPGGRRLPPTPSQPSRLRLTNVHSEGRIPPRLHSPPLQHRGYMGVVNFPRLNPSPSHAPRLQMPPLWRDRTSTRLIENQCPPLIHTDWPSPPDIYSYHEEPLSFEVAANIGRRPFPSPLPNGYKPAQRERILTTHVGLRRNDSDEDDWC